MSRSSTFSSDQAAAAKFGRRALVFLAPILLIIAILEFGLFRTGDSWPVSRVLRVQDEMGEFLYRPAYFSQQFNVYKSAMIKHRQPSILVLGSSRVMKIRDFMFHPLESSFYNAGGMLQTLDDLTEYADMVKAGELPKPRVAIVAVDPWWLKPQEAGGQSWLAPERMRDEAYRFAAHIGAARILMHARPVPWREALAGAGSPSPYYKKPCIGTFAIRHGAGFRSDGSRQEMPAVVLDFIKNPVYVDREEPPIIDRIRENLRQFSLPAQIDSPRVGELLAAFETLTGAGVEVRPFLAPFANEAVAALEQSPTLSQWWREYRDHLPQLLRENGIDCGPPTSPSHYGLDDTYMFDGWHGGEVLMSYIMKDVIRRAPETSILRDVDLAHIDELLNGKGIMPLTFTAPPR
jgi:hypothetical protein